LFGLIQASGTNSFPVKLPGWVAGLLGSSGGWALLVIAFVDSSFGSFPVINDLLVIWLTLKNPQAMVFYASMATLGSVLGCLTIFYLAHKGGEVALRKKASAEQIERIRGWYERNHHLPSG
jgi:membrane protein YqaA with SNARE-associated domain